MNRTVHGSERVKPNTSFDEDTDSHEWLKAGMKHISCSLLLSIKQRRQWWQGQTADVVSCRCFSHTEGDRWIHSSDGDGGETSRWRYGTWWWVCSYLTIQHLWHAASPDSHTLPSALGWKRTFGSRGRPRSPAHGGKEALTECEAVPLCRPHRTSHLGRGGWGNTAHIIIKIIRGATSKARGRKWWNPPDRKTACCQYNNKTATVQLPAVRENFAALVFWRVVIQQFSSHIHSSLREDTVQFQPLHNSSPKFGGVVFMALSSQVIASY